MEEVTLPTYETLLTEAIKSLLVDSGIVTAQIVAGSNSLSDSTKAWPIDIHVHRLVKIIRGQGVDQLGIVRGNSLNSLIIRRTWSKPIAPGDVYVIFEKDILQMLMDMFGSGAVISATNRLPVDITPGDKATTQIITLANLAASATSTIANCVSVDMRHGPLTLALTVRATYNAAAVLGLRVHVRTSPDNVNWDTEDWDVWTAGFTAGATIRETEHYDTCPMYLKVLIENLDAGQAITNLAVISSLGA